MKRKPRADTGTTKAGSADGAADLARGREAFARRAWGEACEALGRADSAGRLVGNDLELLAQASELGGRTEAALHALERVFKAHVDAGECSRAVRAAFWLAMRLFHLGEPGRAGGWLTRAQKQLESADADCVERGYLLLPFVQHNLSQGNWTAGHDAAAGAAQIAERFDDADLLALARTFQGRALAKQGRVKEGLAHFDETMVAASGGELSPIVTGLVYCMAIGACQESYALARAREWTAALSAWWEAQPQLVPFSGACMLHRAELKQLAGSWVDAIDEARRAGERFARDPEGAMHGEAVYRTAEIHRLRGEIDAAEEAYRAASRLGREPQPGLALLRKVQGKRDAAASGIRRALDATSDPLQRTTLLPATVEILLDVGALDEAEAACAELEAVARRFDMEMLDAMAAHARGALLLARGDAARAHDPLRRSFRVWQELGVPYLAARVRVLVGRACGAVGDRDGAALELYAARAVFERLGAALDLAELDSSSRGAPSDAPHGLTPRELEVLRLVASGRTNKAIAKQLFLSEKTVDRHVSNILAKVKAPSRAAATAFAYEHKLV